MRDSRPTDCVFCKLPADRIEAANDLALAFADAFPVSAGHTLVIPRRHVASFFDLTEDEVIAVYRLVRLMRDRLEQSQNPRGFNVGVNIGDAAGQSVGHVHIHVIPRYLGDVDDPFGGVRNVIPGKGRYL